MLIETMLAKMMFWRAILTFGNDEPMVVLNLVLQLIISLLKIGIRKKAKQTLDPNNLRHLMIAYRAKWEARQPKQKKQEKRKDEAKKRTIGGGRSCLDDCGLLDDGYRRD